MYKNDHLLKTIPKILLYRIALYMMREEIRDSPLDSRDPVQHSHDFFVISSCKLEV